MRYLTDQEFSKLRSCDDLIPYMENIEDKDEPRLCWSVFGYPEKNEILVALTGDSVTLIGAKTSSVAFPPMKDRVFGIDVADDALAERMSLELYSVYKRR